LFSSLLFSCEDLGGIIFTIFILSMGVLIATVGGYLLYVSTVPIVFDRRRRFFWKGRKAPDEVVEKSSLAHFAPLEDIHALQLIPEYFRSPKGSFYSYELNLILNDGRRINVVDHGDQNKLREDAETLSGFLEKPVWDAIDDIIRLSNKAM